MMDMEEALKTVVSALECIMDVSSSNETRMNAHKVCEDFRENCKDCIECGFQLAQKDNSDVVRHFGLQSVEHWIKYRWTDVTDEKKSHLKAISLQYVYEGTRDILEESRHTKDAVARILVELMKRLWPQLWEDLFIDFTRLSEKGETQTELVLMVLLRLSEDVVGFQTVPGGRQKDLRQALVRAMPSIVDFFLSVLTSHLAKYSKHTTEVEGRKSQQICLAVLETLQGFVDWIPVSHITDTVLLEQICKLLLEQDQGVSLRATECLLLIVGRRGELSQRKPLMILFSEDAMTVLFKAASNATQHISTSDQTDFFLLFLKRLCEILLEMGKLLSTLWGSDIGFSESDVPPNFSMYLQAVLAFTQHPCQSLRHMIVPLWVTFLKHKCISTDPAFLEQLPGALKCVTECILKIGYPSQHNSPSCDFSRIEFDSDEEFSDLCIRLRNEGCEFIRTLTLQNPNMTFNAGSSWLRELLQKPLIAGTETGLCSQHSLPLIAWDGCSTFLEAVMGKLAARGELPQAHIQEGVGLLHQVLAYDTGDPLVLSCVLTCLSALFPFLPHSPTCLPQVLHKIKAAVVFSLPGQTRSTRSVSVRNVRVHACSMFVKICTNHPSLLLQEFSNLYRDVRELDTNPEGPSQMEKVILTEGLITVSNHFHDFQRQSAFIEELLQPVKEMWSSQEFVRAFSTPAQFMEYVGLDQSAVEPSTADTCGINRSHITSCISTILAVTRRSKCPQDLSIAERGGFVMPGNVLRNPAFPHVMSTLENLVTLLRTACDLFHPECLQHRHPDFVKAFDLPENEKIVILKTNTQVCAEERDQHCQKSPLVRMQFFMMNLWEQCFSIMGNAAMSLGDEFYATSSLVQILIDFVLAKINSMPDDRLKTLIHHFLVVFLRNCPKQHYHDVAVPVLKAVCPQMHEVLVRRWQVLTQKAEERSQNDEDEADSQEILEEHFVRFLTKEYLIFLYSVLFGKSQSPGEVTNEGMDEGNVSADTQVRVLSDLGNKVLETEDVYPSLLLTTITGLSWSDTAVCSKCSSMIWPLCRKLMDRRAIGAEESQFIFMSLLRALSQHGQHDALASDLAALSLKFYEALHADLPVLTSILLEIPNVDKNLITKTLPPLLTPDAQIKRKKNVWKKIVDNIVGKHIGQKFARPSEYSKLPQLFLPAYRHKQQRLDDQETEELGLCDLFAGGDPRPPGNTASTVFVYQH